MDYQYLIDLLDSLRDSGRITYITWCVLRGEIEEARLGAILSASNQEETI